MIEDILKELRELTKFCYGLKTELVVIAENQNTVKEIVRGFEKQIDKLHTITTELENERQRKMGLKSFGTIVLKYWYIAVAVVVAVLTSPSAAMHFLSK